MSAQAATVVEFPSSCRAPAAQPVTKLRAFERVRDLICEGELQHIDMNVVQYLAEITDKETGAGSTSLFQSTTASTPPVASATTASTMPAVNRA